MAEAEAAPDPAPHPAASPSLHSVLGRSVAADSWSQVVISRAPVGDSGDWTASGVSPVDLFGMAGLSCQESLPGMQPWHCIAPPGPSGQQVLAFRGTPLPEGVCAVLHGEIIRRASEQSALAERRLQVGAASGLSLWQGC